MNKYVVKTVDKNFIFKNSYFVYYNTETNTLASSISGAKIYSLDDAINKCRELNKKYKHRHYSVERLKEVT